MKTPTITPSRKKLAVKPVPDGFHTVTSCLVCAGASDAIASHQRDMTFLQIQEAARTACG